MLTWKINLAKGYANLLYRKADDAFHANSIHHRNNNVDSMRLLVLIWEQHSTRRNSWCRYHIKFERKAPLHSSSSDTRHCAILLRVSCFSPATHILFRPQLLPIRIHQQRCRALFFFLFPTTIFSASKTVTWITTESGWIHLAIGTLLWYAISERVGNCSFLCTDDANVSWQPVYFRITLATILSVHHRQNSPTNIG